MPSPLPFVARLAALALLAGALAVPARADDAADVDRLTGAGQYAEALARLDRLLVQRPRDPQLRFRKGVLLTQTQHADEAKEVFARLAEEYPEIPEPHNNLAVLHAAAGDYDLARAALDAALRANPNYAVAHQNMGDIHAQLARQSYARALQLDPANTAVPPKLALLRQLLAAPSAASAPRPSP